MKPFLSIFLGTLLFGLLISACGIATPEENSDPKPEVNVSKPVDTPLPPTPQISIITQEPVDSDSTVPRELVEKAKADLAEYLDINTDQIQIVESRATDWPDASLGCPQPDMTYATVVTPGFWILLEADGEKYPYHTDGVEQMILCLGDSSDSDSPKPLIPIKPGEIDDGEPWVPVD